MIPTIFRHKTQIGSQSPEGTFEKTNPLDLFKQNVQFVFDEGVSWSYLRNNEMYQQRNAQLEELIQEGKIPEYAAKYFSHKGDYGRLAYYAKRHLGIDVKTDEELEQERNQILSARRVKLAEMQSKATFMGEAAGVAGGFAGTLVDWQTPVSMFLGGWSTIGKELNMLSALKTLPRIGAVGMGLEVPRQMMISTHKDRIQSPYSTEDMLMSIAYAGVGDMAFASGGYLFGKLLKRLRKARMEAASNSRLAHELDNAIDELKPRIKDDPVEVVDDLLTLEKSFEHNVGVRTPREEAKLIKDLNIENRSVKKPVTNEAEPVSPEQINSKQKELTEIKTRFQNKADIESQQIFTDIIEDHIEHLENAKQDIQELKNTKKQIQVVDEKIKKVQEQIKVKPSNSNREISHRYKEFLEPELLDRYKKFLEDPEVKIELEKANKTFEEISECLVRFGVK